MNPSHLAHGLAYRTHSWSSGFQKAFLSLLIPACKTCIIGLGGLHTTTVAVLGRHPMVLASLSTGVFTKTEVAHSSMSPLGLVSGNPILPYSGSLQIFSMTQSFITGVLWKTLVHCQIWLLAPDQHCLPWATVSVVKWLSQMKQLIYFTPIMLIKKKRP